MDTAIRAVVVAFLCFGCGDIEFVGSGSGECASDAVCAAKSKPGACEVARCVGGKCTVAADPGKDGAVCSSACVPKGTCSAGACVGAEKDCSGTSGACSVGMCDPATGECDSTPATDGTACDDGDLCTEISVCAAGACTGTPKDCSSLDTACATGACGTPSAMLTRWNGRIGRVA